MCEANQAVTQTHIKIRPEPTANADQEQNKKDGVFDKQALEIQAFLARSDRRTPRFESSLMFVGEGSLFQLSSSSFVSAKLPGQGHL